MWLGVIKEEIRSKITLIAKMRPNKTFQKISYISEVVKSTIFV